MKTKKLTVDMRATLGAELDYYETKTYKPEFAVAEFVDNSTQSYRDTKAILQTYEPGYKLKIDIEYNPIQKTLIIKDNAGGMDKQTFCDALVLGKKPKNREGLNEFGFGMKAAASWFGKKWSVTSTTIKSKSKFKAIVDIKDLVATGKNTVDIEESNDESLKSHFTIIKIWDLKKTISQSNFKKLSDKLSSIYRRYLAKGEITITFNGERLEYVEPECLTTIDDGKEVTWRREFDEEVIFNGKILPFCGFVGLLKEGSYKKSGFTLIRRNRVILGGDESPFKPEAIFGSANSFASLRMFGEVYMDSWPVTQAKDDFDWEMSGLKDLFIIKLKEVCQSYINKAKTYRAKTVKDPLTRQKVQEIADETKRNIESMGPNSKVKMTGDISPITTTTNSDGVETRSYTLPISICNANYKVTVEFICESDADLIVVTPKLTDRTNITISFNTAFPMLEQLKTNNAIFIKVLQKFFVALVIAEEQALKSSDDGISVTPTQIRDNLNQVLIQMSNEGNFDE